MIMGLRDTGYDFDTAVADILDNSIAAEAENIDLQSIWTFVATSAFHLQMTASA